LVILCRLNGNSLPLIFKLKYNITMNLFVNAKYWP
jgi:hypothetical protein